MTLENITNIRPIEECLLLLRSILNHLKQCEPFVFDYSDVLKLLNFNFNSLGKEKQNSRELAPNEKGDDQDQDSKGGENQNQNSKGDDQEQDSDRDNDDQDSDGDNQDQDSENAQLPFSAPVDLSDLFEKLEQSLDDFENIIGTFCPDEIPDLVTMINILEDLVEFSVNIKPSAFHDITVVCKNYVENMTLENITNINPIEECLLLLKSILSHLKQSEPFVFDYSDVLKLLNFNFHSLGKEKQNSRELAPNKSILELETSKTEFAEEKRLKVESSKERISKQEPSKEKLSKKPASIANSDIEILVDFVAESEENLDTIEISLMELEQDPTNKDIINNIFRPFHTIKGISGFLALTKINQLAHATENLLDGARSGDFLINNKATDVILESMDTLKKLLGRVKIGIQNKVTQQDDDININSLIDKLEAVQTALIKGEKEPLGEILINKGMINTQSLEESLIIQKNSPNKKLGEILVEAKKVSFNDVNTALMDQKGLNKKIDVQVKVSTQKLDDLVDYAGELVIAQSMLRQKISYNPSLAQDVAHLGQIVTNMQTIAMSMRMTPIKATFMKMIRLVRDLSQKSGKKVNLIMKGEDTEIDRNVVDALYEPMVHMIRNSIDHGIESEEERLKKGKASTGNIFLMAYHKGGHIIIEIEDDGKGLDKNRILEKANSTNLIPKNTKLTDAQIYDLILQPGFSTASAITDISGRGVGMDVVKDGIEKFRGQLNIDSSKDKGTKFTISLPLTLAIIDGMLVRVADARYVIPTLSVQKAFKPGKEDYFTIKGKGEMVKDRGHLIPLIRLDEIYHTGGNQRQPVWESLVIVVESKDEKRALLIDELLGKDEYVIKSLGSGFEDMKGFSGGAILADGQIGLILDIYGIFSLVSKR
ncbi:MAG: chemotaxis protein CheA [Desulfamplus sp.]|nr:chemotaxis protein CheA [Desulfamplus sp.]